MTTVLKYHHDYTSKYHLTFVINLLILNVQNTFNKLKKYKNILRPNQLNKIKGLNYLKS